MQNLFIAKNLCGRHFFLFVTILLRHLQILLRNLAEFMKITVREPSTQKQQKLQCKNNDGLLDYDTPSKSWSQKTTDKTLMKNVWQKIQASKQNSAHRQSISKNSQSKQYVKVIAKHEIDNSEEKQIILSNQSPSNPGFYQYIHWVKLHAQCFAYVDQKYMQELWKILRLINYGAVLLPTGLIFEIFMDIKTNSKVGGFLNVLNAFLLENDTSDQYSSFRQTKNYIDINQIEKVYKCISDNAKCLNNEQNNRSLRSRCQSVSNVFDRNFNQAKSRTDKKLTKICQAIVQQANTLTEKPKITKYKSESFKSLVKPERICHHAEKHRWKDEQQKYIQSCSGNIQNLFRAKHLDKSIFEGNVESLPGVSEHLSRNKFCEAERLKAKRYAEKPQHPKKLIF